MDITLRNTFDPNLGVNSLLSAGFAIDPDVDSAVLTNWADPNSIIWEAELDDNLTGNFKNLDICIYPDANSNSCNGGNVKYGLPAGASDMLTLSMTGDFSSLEAGKQAVVMLAEFPVKFQGDWGSFEIPGETDCCDDPGDKVPEPMTGMLMLGGIAAYRYSRKRQPAQQS